jgi:hypothetical protein
MRITEQSTKLIPHYLPAPLADKVTDIFFSCLIKDHKQKFLIKNNSLNM